MVNEKDTSDKIAVNDLHGGGNVRLVSLDSGVLNDVIVAGLPGFVGLPVHLRRSRSLLYGRASVCRSHAFGRCFLFSESVHFFPFQFFSENFVSIIREPYSLNWQKLVLNQCFVFVAKWHVTLPYSVTVLKSNYYLQLAFAPPAPAKLGLLFTIVSSTFVHKHRKCI